MLFKRGDIVCVNNYEFPLIGQVVKVTKSKAYRNYNGTHRIKVERIEFVGKEPENPWHYLRNYENIFWNKEITMLKPTRTNSKNKFKAKNNKKMEAKLIKCR